MRKEDFLFDSEFSIDEQTEATPKRDKSRRDVFIEVNLIRTTIAAKYSFLKYYWRL